MVTKASVNTIVPIMAFAISISCGAFAGDFRFASGATQTSLLELYTSEGCSSCPPAEAWLNKLKDSPGLWKDFAPVAFHVDYWNSLGWKDRWSSGAFAERQSDYARLWHAENIYTPEFVLNGEEWHNWLGLRSAPPSSGANAGALEITSTNGGDWQASFTPPAAVNGNFEIQAALLAGGLGADVTGGENRGRKLQHEFTVLDLSHIGLTTSNGVARGKFLLPFARHAAEKNLAVAVWITRAGEMKPLQATGGWLRQ
jgi:hypothetical protein